jgi:hypothetical protein
MSTLLRSAFVLSLVALAGCAPPDPSCWGTPYSCMAMERCSAHTQCASGICEMGSCLDTCEGHTCPATEATDDVDPQCLVTATGRGCRDTCTTTGDGPTVPVGATILCEGGAPIRCLDATSEQRASWCANCGCSTGDNCADDGPGVSSCVTPHPLGQPCTRREECETDHCSPYTHTCRTMVGERCTNATCDFCLLTSGEQRCYQSCDDETPCEPGSVCLSGGSTGRFFCHTDCTADATVCPGMFTCIDATDMPGVRVCNPS